MRLPDATNSCYFCIETIALSEIHFCKYQTHFAKYQINFPKYQIHFPKYQIHFPKYIIHFPKYQIYFPKYPIHFYKYQVHFPKYQIHFQKCLFCKYPICLIYLENMLFLRRTDANYLFFNVFEIALHLLLFSATLFINPFEFNSNLDFDPDLDQEEVTQRHQRVTLDAVSAFLRPSSHPSKMQAMEMVGFSCVSAQSLFFFLD